MHVAGIDLGGTTIKAGIVAPGGQVIRSLTEPTPTDSVSALLDALESILVSLGTRFKAVGLGVPGLRSAETGTIESSPNLRYLNGVGLEVLLEERIQTPVVGRNDAEMYAWGEFSVGAGRGTRDMVCLTLGTGVGSGFVLGGQLYSGSRGYAPEAGHLVVDTDGVACLCGSHGCLETVASANGIVALARRMFGARPEALKGVPEPITAEGLHAAAVAGQAAARAVLAEAGRYLGIACADLINLLNPEAIVIGGGVAGAGEHLLAPAREEARSRAFEPGFEACRIVTSELGSDAGIVGAGLCAHLKK